MTTPAAIVYCATNLVNGMLYIGYTTKALAIRKKRHECDSRKPGISVHFHLAIRKYGIEMFKFSVLKACSSKENARTEEVRLISTLKPQYNKTSGGDGAPGYIATPEVRKNISAKIAASYSSGRRLMRRVICLTDAIIFESVKAAAAHYGVSPSCICNAMGGRTALCKGKIFSALDGPKTRIDLILLMEEIAAERQRNFDKRKRSVICLNDGRKFDSITGAGRAYGMGHQAVDRVARGLRHAARGLRFAFVDNAQ